MRQKTATTPVLSHRTVTKWWAGDTLVYPSSTLRHYACVHWNYVNLTYNKFKIQQKQSKITISAICQLSLWRTVFPINHLSMELKNSININQDKHKKHKERNPAKPN